MPTIENNNDPVVIYHSPCLDGFTSAYVAWREFGNNAKYIPGSYNEEKKLPNVKGREVYILDFSYTQEVMRNLSEEAERVVVLDHHKTAEAELLPLLESGIIEGEFDMERSGAGITWDYFNPGEDRLPFINYVEDRDLWRFDIPGSKEVNQAMFSYEYTFENWDMFANSVSHHGVDMLKEDGEAILRKHMKDIHELKEHAIELTIGGVTVPAINANYTYGSDLAHVLSEGQPFSAYFWMNKEGKMVFGLRSQEDGMDVAEVAVKYNGGGHKNASGFRIDSLKDL